MLQAILIDLIPPSVNKEEAAYRLSEAENLINTYGGVVVLQKIQKKMLPSYKTYIGAGKVEEIAAEAKELGANILIVNNELKPMQIYNLEEMLRAAGLQVWDRIDLILKIFQKHATTREAKLEIELASIRHMGPRIYGMGMQLTRQGGSSGGGGIRSRGVGETNLEIMKRHLSKHEDRILKELEECKKLRQLHRYARKRKHLMTFGIIGYTNAGKSSLLNALTHKGAYAADKLFATLDTRVGKLYFVDSQTEVLLSDTIGFIQNLPTTLIKSFESTLEETIEADLLLHVIDVSDPKMESKIEVVRDVLGKIGAANRPMMYVYNKLDLLKIPKVAQKKLMNKLKRAAVEVTGFDAQFVSAAGRIGLDELKASLEKFTAENTTSQY